MAGKEATYTTAGAASPETTTLLREFWNKTMEEIKELGHNDFKAQELPLARIKKIMKLDDDVKMISAEAPVLFSKAAEIFISELSLRAWIHTEDNKRRTLQRNDIAMAISKFDQFDFLIDIVPRDELKPTKRADDVVQRASMMPDQVQYYFQLAQQAQAALQQQGGTTAAQPAATATVAQPATAAPAAAPAPAAQTQGIQIQGGQIIQQVGQQLQLQIQDQNSGQPQIIQVQVPQQQQPQQTQQQQQPQQQQPQQQQQQPEQQQSAPTTQVLHQIVTPSGEIQNIPIQLTPDQLQAIQLQVQGKQPGQPIVIQTATSANEQVTQLSQSQPMYQIQQVGGQQVFIQQTDDSQQAEVQEG